MAALTLCLVENNSWQLLATTWLKETAGLVVHSRVKIKPNFQIRILIIHTNIYNNWEKLDVLPKKDMAFPYLTHTAQLATLSLGLANHK